MGLRARPSSAVSKSSPAMRLVLSIPHPLQRWTIAHSPSRRTSIAIGSMGSAHAMRRSPGSSSRCFDQRQRGQWLRCRVPKDCAGTWNRQRPQVNAESERDLCDMGVGAIGCACRCAVARDARRETVSRRAGKAEPARAQRELAAAAARWSGCELKRDRSRVTRRRRSRTTTMWRIGRSRDLSPHKGSDLNGTSDDHQAMAVTGILSCRGCVVRRWQYTSATRACKYHV